MLVLCFYDAEGYEVSHFDRAQPYANTRRLMPFSGAVMVECPTDKGLHWAFDAKMQRDLLNWRGAYKPTTYRLAKYLPANAQANFGPGLPLKVVPPPMPEMAPGAPEAPPTTIAQAGGLQ
jgi:hypothetical protein